MTILSTLTGSGDALVPALQHYLTTAAICGLIATLALWAALASAPLLRDVGRKLMSKSVVVRLMMLGWLGEVIVCGAVKPGTGDADYGHEDYGHEMMLCSVRALANTETLGNNTIDLAPCLLSTVSAPLTVSAGAQTLQSTTITNWTVRGAWRDWTRLTFPTNFAFPVGLEWIHGVTLMSWGEVRRDLRTPLTVGDGGEGASTTGESGGHGVTALPTPLAIVPRLTTVSYGLVTSPDSLVPDVFRIAWENAAPNRSTNTLVNAAIELYASGQSVVTYGDSVVTNDVIRPTGVVSGDTLLTLDYTTNLTNWVGTNEQNGRYKTMVTVDTLPASGPCYVVCGTNRIEITSAGTYSFPCEVYDVVETCVYPTNVAYTLSYDDGYTGTQQSFKIVDATAARTAAQSSARRMLMSGGGDGIYDTDRLTGRRYRYMEAIIVCTPEAIRSACDASVRVRTWCNLVDVVYKSFMEGLDCVSVVFTDPDYITVGVEETDTLIYLLYADQMGRYAYGELPVEVIPRYDNGVFTGSATNEVYDATNGCTRSYITADSTGAGTNVVCVTNTVTLAGGESCYVGVFMATAEFVGDAAVRQNDRVWWCVTSDDGESPFQGETTIEDHIDEFIEAEDDWTIPGVPAGGYPIKIAGKRYAGRADGEPITFTVVTGVQNAGDGNYQTCVQVGIYPQVGSVTPGWPNWAEQ